MFFGLDIKAAKRGFFDAPAVKRKMSDAMRFAFLRFGSFVRVTARKSIRKRKRPSPIGQPPSSHVGLLKKFIFFSYDASEQAVVIGPARLNAKNTKVSIPRLLEEGGTVTSDKRIFVEEKQGRDARGRFGRKKKKFVRVTRLRYGKRPYMSPAFEKEKPGLPKILAGSIR